MLLLCSQCGWEHAGEILKSSVLVREVSQWRAQEETSINPCFFLDLCYLQVDLTEEPIYI